MTTCKLVDSEYGYKCKGNCEHTGVCDVCGKESSYYGKDDKEYCNRDLCAYIYHARNLYATGVLRDIKRNDESFKEAPYVLYAFGRNEIKSGLIASYYNDYLYMFSLVQDGDMYRVIGDKPLKQLKEKPADLFKDGETAYTVQNKLKTYRLENESDVYLTNTRLEVGNKYTKQELGVEVTDSIALVLKYENLDNFNEEGESTEVPTTYYSLNNGKLEPFKHFGEGESFSSLTVKEQRERETTLGSTVTEDYYGTFDIGDGHLVNMTLTQFDWSPQLAKHKTA